MALPTALIKTRLSRLGVVGFAVKVEQNLARRVPVVNHAGPGREVVLELHRFEWTQRNLDVVGDVVICLRG